MSKDIAGLAKGLSMLNQNSSTHNKESDECLAISTIDTEKETVSVQEQQSQESRESDNQAEGSEGDHNATDQFEVIDSISTYSEVVTNGIMHVSNLEPQHKSHSALRNNHHHHKTYHTKGLHASSPNRRSPHKRNYNGSICHANARSQQHKTTANRIINGLFVSSVHARTTAAQMALHVYRETGLTVKPEQRHSKYPDEYSTFLIPCDKRRRQTLSDKNIWPRGIYVGPNYA